MKKHCCCCHHRHHQKPQPETAPEPIADIPESITDIPEPMFSVLSDSIKPTNIVRPINDEFLSKFLIASSVLLMLATYLLIFAPTHSEYIKPQNITKQKIIPVNEINLEDHIEILENQIKTWKRRIWLLAVSNNENAALSQKIDNAYHRNQHKGYVFLDQNWKEKRLK